MPFVAELVRKTPPSAFLQLSSYTSESDHDRGRIVIEALPEGEPMSHERMEATRRTGCSAYGLRSELDDLGGSVSGSAGRLGARRSVKGRS